MSPGRICAILALCVPGCAARAPHRRGAAAQPRNGTRRWLRAALEWLARVRQRRLCAAELAQMDERMLRDVGLTRADVPAVLSGDYLRDETRSQRATGDGRCERGAARSSKA